MGMVGKIHKGMDAESGGGTLQDRMDQGSGAKSAANPSDLGTRAAQGQKIRAGSKTPNLGDRMYQGSTKSGKKK